MHKLFPCPFCGAKPIIKEDNKECISSFVKCSNIKSNCPLLPCTSWWGTVNESIKAWNARDFYSIEAREAMVSKKITIEQIEAAITPEFIERLFVRVMELAGIPYKQSGGKNGEEK